MRRLVFGLLVLALCGTAAAQPQLGLPSPRLQYVFPPGANAGPTPIVRHFGLVIPMDHVITVTGTDLDEPEKLLFSHPGITSEYIEPEQPEAKSPPDPKTKKKDNPKGKGGQRPQHQFRVKIDSAVPPGTYDVRVVGQWGVSNPRAFVVGSLPEIFEKEPNNDLPEAQRIELGTTINGSISAGTDVDYSIFAGKKGQRVLVSCLASSIDGLGNPMIEVYDTKGRKLATNRNYQNSDALADVFLPADGDYYIRLSQFTYQGGGPDHVYRLTATTGPWIDAVFPLAVEPGKPTQITLYGRNLPNSEPADGYEVEGRPLEKLTVTVNPPGDADARTQLQFDGRVDPATALADGFSYTFEGPTGRSNTVPIYFTHDKLIVKKNASAATPETAEDVAAPCEVAGFPARRGEVDWYRFQAKKGDQFLIEVFAQRAGTAADFFLSVRDGKDPKRDLSGELDDNNETLHPFGFFTRNVDPPAYSFTAPADGQYLVKVGCRESSVLFGPRSAYRLRISPAQPDFRVIALPYSRHLHTGSNARQDGQQAYDVFVHRMDGYTGTIRISAEGLPPGVTAESLSIGPTARWGVLVLTIAADAAEFTGAIRLKATGTTPGGQTLARTVRPATVVWGVNIQQSQAPAIARLTPSLLLAVRPEKALFKLKPDFDKATRLVNMKNEKLPQPLVLRQGEKLSVPIKVLWAGTDKQPVTLTAEPLTVNQQSNPITVRFATQPTKEKPEAVVKCDVKANAVPGTYTLTIRGVAQVPYAKDPMAKQKPNVPVDVLADPIEVLIIPSALAKVTTGPLPNNTLKQGTTVELPIKVERLHDFAGEFQIKFLPATEDTGVSVDDVTIAAGKDTVKLPFVIAKDAKPGMLAGTIVVTGDYAGKYPVIFENKVSFTIAK